MPTLLTIEIKIISYTLTLEVLVNHIGTIYRDICNWYRSNVSVDAACLMLMDAVLSLDKLEFNSCSHVAPSACRLQP